MKLTGAQIIMECLLREGVDTIFGYPGGANLPMYDTLPQYPEHPAHPRAPRAGRRPRRRRLRPRHRQGRRLLGHLRPRRDEPRHRHRQRLDGLRAAGLHHRAAVVSWLIGRDGFQEADITGITIPITKHNALVLNVEDIAPAIARGVPHRDDRPARPRARRHPARRAAADLRVRVPGRGQPARLPADVTKGDPQQIKRAAELIDEVGAPGDPRRPRRRHLARLGRAASSWPRRRRHPGDHDAARPRRLPGHARAVHGHARHARHVLEQHGDQRGRPR